ncbi:musculoskeletal embryonic nuclear protein 1a isoform X1 [Gambusia affinis]|uniref:musculoskeletal embryonic nuclear protein 1a isoform X1 n=1 Tax=Gambusia affinis TaxID=33528 RepID=UPI001CDD3E78|nr:musculoskeletal embryonic nuclear protein 1a isoform X1 [Gambusia affinis]
MSQPAQEDEQAQRPVVREEDLTEAKTKLGGGGAVKSKTFEVMEECDCVNLFSVWSNWDHIMTVRGVKSDPEVSSPYTERGNMAL